MEQDEFDIKLIYLFGSIAGWLSSNNVENEDFFSLGTAHQLAFMKKFMEQEPESWIEETRGLLEHMDELALHPAISVIFESWFELYPDEHQYPELYMAIRQKYSQLFVLQ